MSKLLLDQAVFPPRLQAFASLDNIHLQMIPLRDNELLCTLPINHQELLAVLVHLIIGIVEARGFGDCGLRRKLGTPVTAVRVVRIHLVDGDEVY